MEIFTLYYAKMKKCMREYALVRISVSMPSWFPVNLPGIPELYPGWDLVNGIKNGSITQEQYTQRYREHLATLNKGAIISRLKQISNAYGKDTVILLCWEAPNKFCHRHLVAEWLGGIKEWRE